MNIVFYEAKFSSATPVAWGLAELAVPHERVRFDLKSGAQRRPEFLKLNPNGKVPTLVIDGTPMFEALAINLWLADRFGVERGVWPQADSPLRGAAMAWSTWAYVTFGSVLSRHLFCGAERFSQEFRDAARPHSQQELQDMVGILNQRVAEQPYLLGNEFSMADLIVASVLGFAVTCGVTLDANPQAKAWLERCQARPSRQAILRD